MGETQPSQSPVEPFRPAAPGVSQQLAWPNDFGNRFTVFVDTEEEFDWTAPFDRSAHTTEAIAGLPAAHRRFADQGVPLCYLVDYPVAADPRAVDTIARLIEQGGSSVGTQLHPWVNPPFDEVVSDRNSFAGNLDPVTERAKISVLTGLIAEQFGRRPQIYRAGRYGIGAETFAILADLGYRIDSSMRSRYDYSHEGGPDFRAIANHAFRAGPGDSLVEIPLTTVFVGRLGGRGRRLQHQLSEHPLLRSLLARFGLLETIALTPEDMPIEAAMQAVRVAVDHGVRLLNFSFHSPSLVPGNTVYVRDAADLEAFHGWWRSMFALLDELGVKPASEGDLIAAIDRAA